MEEWQTGMSAPTYLVGGAHSTFLFGGHSPPYVLLGARLAEGGEEVCGELIAGAGSMHELKLGFGGGGVAEDGGVIGEEELAIGGIGMRGGVFLQVVELGLVALGVFVELADGFPIPAGRDGEDGIDGSR